MKKISALVLSLLSSTAILAVPNYAGERVNCKFENEAYKLDVYFAKNYEHFEPVPEGAEVGNQTASMTVLSKFNNLTENFNYNNVSHIWDGHGAGMLSSPYFSVRYENHFGQIKNVTLITFVGDGQGSKWVETYHADKCVTVS